MKYFVIYTTTKTDAEAKKIANVLLKKKLIACAQIIPRIESMYWWKGKIVKSDEVGMLAKTSKSLVDRTVVSIKKIHSYNVPEIIALPIAKGNENYFKWIDGVVEK